MVYNTLKPAANDNLNVSQGDIQGNFLTANTVMAIDHYPFNDVTPVSGYHKIVHQPFQTIAAQAAWDPVNTSPAYVAIQGTKIADVNQLFSMNYTPDTTGGTADTQLFAMTGKGGISQLTGNSADSDGWCWIGGILLQWGKVTSNSSAGAVIFKDRVAGAIPFPNTLFNVQFTAIVTSLPTNNSTIYQNSTAFTKLGFTWNQVNRASSQTGFYWFAVGN